MLDTLVPAGTQQTGAAFSTTDLLLLRGWSEFHGLSMGIDLARRVDDVHCDEVVLLAARDGSGRWALWCDRHGIVLQPQHRAAHSFATVHEAMAAIAPPSADVLTDIQATGW